MMFLVHMENMPSEVLRISFAHRPPTWRGSPLEMAYIVVGAGLSGNRMHEIYTWAMANGLPNPRVVSPFLLELSKVFNPLFYNAISRKEKAKTRISGYCCYLLLDSIIARLRFRLQSMLFLSAVTMSAAIIQSRWSKGTIESKYDKLWQAGQFAEEGVTPELRALDLKAHTTLLAQNRRITDLNRLIAVREMFEEAIRRLTSSLTSPNRIMVADRDMARSDKFGFVDALRTSVPTLQAIVIYGSSISSEHFADYDLMLICKRPIDALVSLAGTSPSWNGKELNIGIYSPEEFRNMQLLSGDNLSDYGVCLFGELNVPHKPIAELLARNMSFGAVRHRQQLGMIAASLAPPESDVDDRRNLYAYFVKIPSNIVKGTYGAVGNRISKETVHSWLREHCDFDTEFQQNQAVIGHYGPALAAAAVGTERALAALNDELGIFA